MDSLLIPKMQLGLSAGKPWIKCGIFELLTSWRQLWLAFIKFALGGLQLVIPDINQSNDQLPWAQCSLAKRRTKGVIESLALLLDYAIALWYRPWRRRRQLVWLSVLPQPVFLQERSLMLQGHVCFRQFVQDPARDQKHSKSTSFVHLLLLNTQ